jgi:GINS complex subunit 4
MGERARPTGPDDRLMRAWINERCAPTLLPYAHDVVVLVQGRMDRVEQHMLEKADDEQFQKWATYHALELDRIRFLLKSYLRCRLVKIQMFAFHICQDELVMARLSDKEQEFARALRQTYAASMEMGILVGVVRQDLKNVESVTEMSDGPDLKQHVVVISESSDTLVLGFDGVNPITLAPGVMAARRFDLITRFLDDGQVRLT